MAIQLNDLLDTLAKIKDLVGYTYQRKSPTDNNDNEKILRVAIEEQRRTYDWIDKSYDQLRLKILTVLGGGLAALTFLYSTGTLFIPQEIYGRIFYFSGLGMLISALGILIFALKPLPWEFSIEDRDLLQLPANNIVEYLEYTKQRHMVCYQINIRAYNFKQRLFNLSLNPLIFGSIILVVIKLFRG